MILSVRDVLELPVFADSAVELVTGGDALDTPVRWVHVSELLETAALLTGGELILSTGLMIGADVEAAARHLAQLQQAGAAGIIVELPAGREPTRSALRRAAAETTVPVVILHNQTRFVDVTEAVHRLIVADQLEQLEANRRIHELFTDLALRGAAPERIVNAAAELLGATVVLEDPSGTVVAFGSAPDAAEHPSRPPAGAAPECADGGPTEVVALVSVREAAWGQLRVTRRADATARHVAERAAQAIALHLIAERDDKDLAALAQSTFLADVSAGELEPAQVDEQATALGLTHRGAIVPLVLHWSGSVGPLEAMRRERRLREVISSAVRRCGASALVGRVGPDSVAVIVAAATRPAGIEPVIDCIAADVTAAHLDAEPAPLWIGAGPAATAVHVAAAGLAEAGHVAAAAAGLGTGTRNWFRSSDVRLKGLVALLADEPRVTAFATSELGPLLAPERRDDLAVIRALTRSGGSKSGAAEALYLSRPALYHRIARLERELGVSLSEPGSLLSLGVAVLVADTLND
ncbi:PucR family transcriptional regulator [Tsukamurella serpentis]